MSAVVVMSLRDLLLRYRKDPRFIVSVPLVILVLIFQRKILAGLTAGAMKG